MENASLEKPLKKVQEKSHSIKLSRKISLLQHRAVVSPFIYSELLVGFWLELLLLPDGYQKNNNNKKYVKHRKSSQRCVNTKDGKNTL